MTGREQHGDEQAAMERNRGRFALEGQPGTDRWRVIDIARFPPIPVSEWMSREDAIVERDRQYRTAD
jgi:hypothetical protein